MFFWLDVREYIGVQMMHESDVCIPARFWSVGRHPLSLILIAPYIMKRTELLLTVLGFGRCMVRFEETLGLHF